MKTDETQGLLKILNIDVKKSELLKALTHKSFYDNQADENKTNSRYVFLGMYAFKGKVAEICNQYISGSGTQLQHYLGNLFTKERLEVIFQKYKLRSMIRFNPSLDVENQKHIFVYGFLGFVFSHFTEEKLNFFIYKNLLENSEHLLHHQKASKDVQAQCKFMIKMIYNCKTEVKISKQENNVFLAQIWAKKQLIAEAESVSYRYVQKKVYKTALKTLGEISMNELSRSIPYQIREAERNKQKQAESEALKTHKAEQYQMKIEMQHKKREDAKMERIRLAKERDATRKKLKATAKERAEIKKKADAKKAKQMQTMSANKRRHIQDKMK